MSTSVSKHPGPMTRKLKIGWLISIIIPFIIMLIPVNDVFTAPIRAFFAITVCFILLLAFEVVDNFVPSLFLPAAYIVFKVAEPSIALASWTSEMPWVIMASFFLVNIIEKTGLLKRVAYWIIYRTGGTYQGIFWGFLIAGIVLNIFLPGGVVIPVMAMGYGICVALNLGRTKAAAGIMIASCIGGVYPTYFFIAPAYGAFCLNCAKAGIPTLESDYITYLLHNLPFLLFAVIMMLIAMKMFKSDVEFRGKEYFKAELDKLGPTTKEEKKAALIMLGLCVYLVTMGIHKLGMSWGFMLAACAMYLPGISLGTSEDVKHINMSIVFFSGACLSIGTVATSLGIGEIMTNMLLPLLDGRGRIGLFSVVFVVVFLRNFLMTPSAIMAIMAGPLVLLGQGLGMDPLAMVYALNAMGYQIILPYEHTTFLIMFSFGMMSMKDFAKFFSINTVVCFIFLMVVMLPYWAMLGLL